MFASQQADMSGDPGAEATTRAGQSTPAASAGDDDAHDRLACDFRPAASVSTAA